MVGGGVAGDSLGLGTPQITPRSNCTALATRLLSCTRGIVPGEVGVVTEFPRNLEFEVNIIFWE